MPKQVSSAEESGFLYALIFSETARKDQVPAQTLWMIGGRSFDIDGSYLFSLMVSLNGLLVALFTVLVSKWMSKYKEGGVFMVSAFCYGLVMMLMSSTLSLSAWLLLFAIVLFSWAELMTVGAQDSFVAKLAPPELRGQYFAASGLRFSLGRTIAPISIPMTVWFGYPWTFILLGIVAFIGMVLYGLLFSMFYRRRRAASVSTQI